MTQQLSTIRIAVNGARGRMGREILEHFADQEDLKVVALWEHSSHPDVVGHALVNGMLVTPPFQSEVPVDVVVDFTNAQGLASLLLAWTGNASLVSGSTGISQETKDELGKLALRTPVFHANNMSIGIAVLRELLQTVARRLDSQWDVELLEMHHRRKIDAPSGTAASLVETLVECWPEELSPVSGREGLVGERKSSELGVFSLRGGDVVGEHEVLFAGPGETLRLGHTAISRRVFANGAGRAVRFVVRQKPGLFSMGDLFNSAAGSRE